MHVIIKDTIFKSFTSLSHTTTETLASLKLITKLSVFPPGSRTAQSDSIFPKKVFSNTSLRYCGAPGTVMSVYTWIVRRDSAKGKKNILREVTAS
jgi:hypothetical protein